MIFNNTGGHDGIGRHAIRGRLSDTQRREALPLLYAGMMKLVNMLDLGSSAERLVGSSPTTRTTMNDPRVVIRTKTD